MKRISISQLAIVSVSALIVAAGCQKTGSSVSLPDAQVSEEAVSFVPTVAASDAETKATLINAGGDGPIAFNTSDVFYVSAWDINGTSTVRTIPHKDKSYTFDKVKYFGTDLTPEETDVTKKIYRNSWNPVNPEDETKLIEYTWKSVRSGDEFLGADKAFYAYANLPAGAAAPVVAMDGSTGLPGAMTLSYDIASQNDILVAYYHGEGNVNDKPTGTASLLFLHPLSSVSVTLGTIKGVNKFHINSIGVENIHAGGTLSMTPTGEDSKVTLIWYPDGTTSLSQDVGMDITSETPSGTVLGEPFLVLPQDLSAAPARLYANVTADGRTFNIYWALASSSFEAGKTHIYALNYDGHEGIQLWENGPYWATMNVGASKPEEAGWYFSWGNVKGYVPVDLQDDGKCRWVEALDHTKELVFDTVHGFESETYSATELQGKGVNLDVDIPAEAVDGVLYDAAAAINGTKWRIPTASELEALFTKTEWDVITRNNMICFIFRGTEGVYARRSIVLPYCGIGVGSKLRDSEGVYYCSSTISDPVNGYQGAKYMNLLYKFTPPMTVTKKAQIKDNLRMNGCVIRPVENTKYDYSQNEE